MVLDWLKRVVVCVMLCGVPVCIRAEMARSVQAAIPIERLRPLASKSGYIFAGTVTSIEAAKPNNAKDVATMRITFHVDRGVRGVKTGQMLAIREWAGVWEYGQRYRIGEKVFLFLYSPSKLGLTSVVGGVQGRFPMNREGGVGLNPVLLPVTPVRQIRLPQHITIPLLDFERAVRAAERNAP